MNMACIVVRRLAPSSISQGLHPFLAPYSFSHPLSVRPFNSLASWVVNGGQFPTQHNQSSLFSKSYAPNCHKARGGASALMLTPAVLLNFNSWSERL